MSESTYDGTASDRLALLDAAASKAIERLAAYRYVARGDALRNPVCTEPLRSAGRAIVAEIEQEAVSAKIAAEGNKNQLFRGVKPRFEMRTPMFTAWSRWPGPSFSELSHPANHGTLSDKEDADNP